MLRRSMIPIARIRRFIVATAWLIVTTTAAAFPQSELDLRKFFRQDLGLTEGQIDDIRKGKAVVNALPSRTPAEVFLLGAIYIHAAPEKYLQFERDFDRRRELPAYWHWSCSVILRSCQTSGTSPSTTTRFRL